MQCLLSGLHEFGNPGIVGNRQVAFGEHDLGSCLHELFGRTNRPSWIVWQGTPDAFKFGADPPAGQWFGESLAGRQLGRASAPEAELSRRSPSDSRPNDVRSPRSGGSEEENERTPRRRRQSTWMSRPISIG